MEKYIDINEKGFSIRCKLFYQKDFRNIPSLVICTHGFGGNKENHSAAKFAQQLITKYKGYDPEINTSSSNLTGGQYPQMRVYSIGAKLTF